MIQVFQAIYAIAKAVPIIDGWVQQFLDYWNTQKVKEVEEYYSTRQSKRSVVLASLKKAETHEEKRVLMSLLGDIERM